MTVPMQKSGTEDRRIDKPQFGLAALLAAIGIYTVYDASTLNVGFGDPVGPRLFPYIIGGIMIGLSVILAFSTLKGDLPQAEEGENIDLTHAAEWTTVLKLVGVLVFTIATINVLGWAVSGAVLFAGCAWALGSRTLLRDILIGLVMSVGSWYGFYVGLDIPLTPGILDGIL